MSKTSQSSSDRDWCNSVPSAVYHKQSNCSGCLRVLAFSYSRIHNPPVRELTRLLCFLSRWHFLQPSLYCWNVAVHLNLSSNKNHKRNFITQLYIKTARTRQSSVTWIQISFKEKLRKTISYDLLPHCGRQGKTIHFSCLQLTHLWCKRGL